MQYRLRTLLIVLALGPPVLAWGWYAYSDHAERERMVELLMQRDSEFRCYAGTWESFSMPKQYREEEMRRQARLWQKARRENKLGYYPNP